MPRSARVAELVDAPDSKSGGSNTVGVRFPSGHFKKRLRPFGVVFFYAADNATKNIRALMPAYIPANNLFKNMPAFLPAYFALNACKIEVQSPKN